MIAVFTDLSPLSLVVSQGDERHVFRCTGPGAERVDVQIDDTEFNDQDIINRGITVSSNTTGIIVSTITIPAIIDNNGTMIQCISINFTGPSILLSPIATYLVQGQ